MSSGPQHYAEADRALIHLAAMGPAAKAEIPLADLVGVLGHALLALTAATVGNAEQDMDKVDENVAAWAGVLA